MTFTIALIQFSPIRRNPAQNILLLKILLENIQADLVVLPELSNCGYLYPNPKSLGLYSEPAPGEGLFLSSLRDIAKSTGGVIVAGYSEKDNDKLFNAAAAVGPKGVLANYQKTHLYADEKELFKPGETGFQTFEWKDVCIGMMICFDWIFPESARTLTLKGAQIIAHPANLVMPYCQQAMITRSIENQIFTITANRIGKESLGNHELHFTGQSQMTSPKGEVLWRGPEEGSCVHLAEIDPQLADDKNISHRNHLIIDRRPDHYLP